MTRRVVLVTGASGFVGRQTLRPLAQRGFEVHAIGRRRTQDLGTAAFHEAGLGDRPRLRALLKAVRPTHVLHAAWFVDHGRFWTASENLDWIAITAGLAREAAAAGVARFVGIGSCAEYDWSDGGAAARREDDPIAPATRYGAAKADAFRALEDTGQATGMAVAWARLFHLYGPGEAPGRLVPSVAGALLAGREARLGPAHVQRDYLNVCDAGAALAALVEGSARGAINVASGEAVSIGHIAALLGALTGRPELIRLGALPARPDDPTRMCAEVTRLAQEVCWRPGRTLNEGLSQAVQALRMQQPAAPPTGGPPSAIG
jgi:nucleoside-diphosphate-sugar epimerase